MNPGSSVAVVVSIVSYRAPRLAIDCLAALGSQVGDCPDTRVIVVDNDSGDGTAQAIEEAIREHAWGSWVELVRAERNGGFAYGNNCAARLAREKYPGYRYLMLLNPDTLIRPGALQALRAFMDANPAVGIAGGRCEDANGIPQASCFRFPSMIAEFASQVRLGLLDRLLHAKRLCMGDFATPVEVGWVVGALMLIRRKVFDDIGLMDEGFFLYYEETDFSLRARRAGWPTWHVPEARAVHFAGQITGVQPNVLRPRRLPAYWYDSRRRYFVLNHGLFKARLVDLAALLGSLLYALRRAVEGKPVRDPEHWISDLVRQGPLGRGRSGIRARQTV